VPAFLEDGAQPENSSVHVTHIVSKSASDGLEDDDGIDLPSFTFTSDESSTT
jgi:hypothetical protein